MNQLQINPPGVEGLFEQSLRACFPQWGDATVSQWFFVRTAGGAPADRLVVAHRGALLAGTALTHRRLRLAPGVEVPVGILTAAWTLPQARNQGLFSRLAAESVKLGRERGLALILAFVTDLNPSSRALARLGFAAVPAAYSLAHPGSTPHRTPPPSVVITHDSEAGDLAERARARRSQSVRIVYRTVQEWSSQFLERPYPTRILRLQRDARAVVEEVGDTDRIQFLLGESEDWRAVLESIRGWCAMRQRSAFLYSTTPEIGQAATDAGFESKGGCIRVAVADVAVLAGALGMTGQGVPAGARDLVDPTSPWFLGDWDVQAGDKM